MSDTPDEKIPQIQFARVVDDEGWQAVRHIRQVVFVEEQESVQRPTDLECTRLLAVLALEEDIRAEALGKERSMHERRSRDRPLDPGARVQEARERKSVERHGRP